VAIGQSWQRVVVGHSKHPGSKVRVERFGPGCFRTTVRRSVRHLVSVQGSKDSHTPTPGRVGGEDIVRGSHSCTAVNSLCYNSVTEQGQLL